jgi:hypothetical protein
MSKPLPSTGMLSVYDGRTYLGAIIPRGKTGHEAFDVEGVSLGLHPDQKAAMAAVAEAAEAEAGNQEEEPTP